MDEQKMWLFMAGPSLWSHQPQGLFARSSGSICWESGISVSCRSELVEEEGDLIL